MTTTPLTVAILGPGGVGGLIGAVLARAGHRVICLAGDETAGVLRRDGLHVESGRFGDFTVPVEADTELREHADAVFVTVKETSLSAALDRVPPQVLGGGAVVPLLNGVQHMELLRRRYPAGGQVVAGTIKVEATRVAPGRITHTSPFAALELAAPPQALETALREAGFGVAVRDDETAMLWDKLSFLAPLALLTTRHRATIGDVRQKWGDELHAVAGEVAAVARAAGAPVGTEKVLAALDAAPAGMRSSMQRDAEAARPIELDAIGGAVLRTARAHGVDVPVTARVVGELAAADDAPWADVEAFLRDRGADRLPHPGGTLLAHLVRVRRTLAAWGADRDVQAAGLSHAAYGTDGFDQTLVGLDERAALADLIGERAEAYVHLYGSCDRSAVHPRLGLDPAPAFRDRFTGAEHTPDGAALRAFAEISAANELDLVEHNPDLAARYGPALAALFTRAEGLLSAPARDACARLLAPYRPAADASPGLRVGHLDHLVLTVADLDRTIAFYERVLGMEAVTFGEGRRALAFGSSKINLHQAGRELLPHAARPTPGSADLCLVTPHSQDRVLSHLAACGVAAEAGPVPRTGALGPFTSTYFRDPDGNLIEVSRYTV